MQRWRGSSMVEQWTHKPLDVGSNPTLATFCIKRLDAGLPIYLVPRKYPSGTMSHPRHYPFIPPTACSNTRQGAKGYLTNQGFYVNTSAMCHAHAVELSFLFLCRNLFLLDVADQPGSLGQAFSGTKSGIMRLDKPEPEPP